MRIPRAKAIAVVGLITGSLALTFANEAAALPSSAPAEVAPISVPGTTAPVVGVDMSLPPLSQTQYYQAGPSPAKAIRAYRASGKYVQDQQDVAAAAETFLADWLATTCGDTSQAVCRPVAVFDIDDTLVSWYPVYNAIDFRYSNVVNNAAIKECATPVIAPVRALLNKAKALGAEVFLLSGRPDTQRTQTEACLRKRGVTGWSKLVLRSADQASLTAAQYKSAQRAKWEGEGWRLGLTIGDQVSDLAGGHVAGGFLLPNPMYYIP